MGLQHIEAGGRAHGIRGLHRKARKCGDLSFLCEKIPLKISANSNFKLASFIGTRYDSNLATATTTKTRACKLKDRQVASSLLRHATSAASVVCWDLQVFGTSELLWTWKSSWHRESVLLTVVLKCDGCRKKGKPDCNVKEGKRHSELFSALDCPHSEGKYGTSRKNSVRF